MAILLDEKRPPKILFYEKRPPFSLENVSNGDFAWREAPTLFFTNLNFFYFLEIFKKAKKFFGWNFSLKIWNVEKCPFFEKMARGYPMTTKFLSLKILRFDYDLPYKDEKITSKNGYFLKKFLRCNFSIFSKKCQKLPFFWKILTLENCEKFTIQKFQKKSF